MSVFGSVRSCMVFEVVVKCDCFSVSGNEKYVGVSCFSYMVLVTAFVR